MFHAFFHGLVLVLQWPAIGFLLLGMMLGIWLGAVPGLGGILGMVVLLPFTFNMEPVSAFALLLALYAVTSTSDSITAVMLGIPGTVASQATILDGYPLAKMGQASRALGAAFTVSACGGVFGAVLLALSLPVIEPFILAFGAPEIFMLGVMGLVMVGLLSGRSLLKGLIAALFGILLSTIGYAESVAVPRYWFGTTYLLDGLPLVPTVLGFFAIPELLDLATRNVSISAIPKDQSGGGGILGGMRDARRHWWIVLRCSAIGTYIGMLPGLGAAISDWIAYGHVVQTSRDKSRFGKGDIRGVIAPESANNSTRGGELIPTVAFGVPGSVGAAILLGALVIQGLRPGPDLLTTKLDFTFSLVWTLIIANILAAGLLMLWARQVAKIAFIDGHLIVPGVICFVFMGAWLGGASFGDWITCFAMGALGYAMKKGGWARPPLVLALVLGPILETNLHIANRSYSGYSWLGKPLVLVLLAILVVMFFFVARGVVRTLREQRHETEVEASAGGEGGELNPVVSLPLAVLFVAIFAYAALAARQWQPDVAQFPMLASVPGLLLAVWAVARDASALRRWIRRFGSFAAAARSGAEQALAARSGGFLAYLLGVLLLAPLVGQIAALAIYVAVYLWRWGHYRWMVSLGYAAIAALLLYGFYDQVLHIEWMDSLLFG
jgi:putative tricarboxylic transport membrane protein